MLVSKEEEKGGTWTSFGGSSVRPQVGNRLIHPRCRLCFRQVMKIIKGWWTYVNSSWKQDKLDCKKLLIWSWPRIAGNYLRRVRQLLENPSMGVFRLMGATVRSIKDTKLPFVNKTQISWNPGWILLWITGFSCTVLILINTKQK